MILKPEKVCFLFLSNKNQKKQRFHQFVRLSVIHLGDFTKIRPCKRPSSSFPEGEHVVLQLVRPYQIEEIFTRQVARGWKTSGLIISERNQKINGKLASTYREMISCRELA